MTLSRFIPLRCRAEILPRQSALRNRCLNSGCWRGIFKAIYREIQGFQPDLIVTHNPGDTHQEHRAVVEVVEIATRQIDMCKEGGHNFRWNVIYGLGVGAYENSGNWLLPNYFVIQSETEAVSKVDMLNEYGTEMRGIRTADNTLIDLRYFGAEYAEPFHVKRICVR